MTKAFYLAATLGSLAIATSAMAQDMNVMRAMAQSCRADVRTHCPSAGMNPNNIMTCLQTNIAKLTPPCQEATRAMAAARAAKGAPSAKTPPTAAATPPATPPAPPAPPPPAKKPS